MFAYFWGIACYLVFVMGFTIVEKWWRGMKTIAQVEELIL